MICFNSKRFNTATLGAVACVVAVAASPVAAQERRPTPAAERTPALREGLFTEPAPLTKAMDFVNRRSEGRDGESSGFYLETGNMVTGAGWIAAGPGYRHHFLNGRAVLDASAGVSWRFYKMAQLRLEATPFADNDRVTVGTQLRWQDLEQVSYFGDGPDAARDRRTEYSLRSTNIAGYSTLAATEAVTVSGTIGLLGAPAIGPPGGVFKRDNPFTGELFASDPVFAVSEQPSFLYGEVAVSADTRNEPGYPTDGALYRAAWSSYSDRDTGTFSFKRYEAEAARFVPINFARTVIAMHGWLVASDTAEGQHVPFYLLPALGGNNTIRGFTDYRFHDRHLLLATLEARVPMYTHVDFAVFMDAGNVAPRVRDLDLGKRSYGVGLRLHNARSTFARLDFARATEGWHVVFRLNDPIRLSRLARRSAPVPFAP